jgi:hypothetical protein
MHDAVDSAFTDTDEVSYFAEANLGIFGNTNQHVGMIR